MKDNNHKTKHKPPSRITYEKNNPVFSIRMPQKWHDDFKTYCGSLGLSRKEFIAIALDKIKVDYVKASNDGYQKGFSIGQQQGQIVGNNKAVIEWGIQFPCSVCGELIYLPPNSDCHKAVIEFLKTMGWGHEECSKKILSDSYSY